MLRATVAVAAALWSLLLASCNGGDTSQTPVPAATLAPPVVDTGRPDPAETPCEASTPRFSARGTVSILGGSSPDASVLSGFDWITEADCERIVLSFLTSEGAPASQIGLSRLEFSPRQGVVRVVMPRDVTASALADVLVDGAFIERAYVVRSRNGDLAVDLHVAVDTPIEARALHLGSPARLVIDVQTGPEDPTFVSSPPSIGSDVVLLSPPPGAAEYPLRIRGYARTPDDIVTATVAQGGIEVERRVTAADSSDAWGEFAVTISEGVLGESTLLVEADPAQTASAASGVSIALTLQ